MERSTLPVNTIDVKEYVKQYEAAHKHPKSDTPTDPSSRWFKKDPLTECIDACRFELYKTAKEDGGLQERYALLQPDCVDACRDRFQMK